MFLMDYLRNEKQVFVTHFLSLCIITINSFKIKKHFKSFQFITL